MGDAADGFRVYPSGSAYDVEVVFIGEIEEENVVCLAVYSFLDGIGLIGDEGCKYAEVAHAGHDVIPVSFTKVQMRFLCEEEDCSKLPVRKGIHQFAKGVFDDYLSVDV